MRPSWPWSTAGSTAGPASVWLLEFFGDDAFTEVVKGQRRVADRFAVAERMQRLGEQLMPILDRINRMMIRNLKAIKELRQGQVPAIAIGPAEQVTVTNRPPRRLHPLKGEPPQPDVTTAAITSGSDARSAADGVVMVPSNTRRARQRERSVARSPQTPPRRGTRLCAEGIAKNYARPQNLGA
jgi:hypothetical protein